jgi:hypothetical protein
MSPHFLKSIQYYVSEPVLLIQESASKDAAVSDDHEVVILKNRMLERIKIKDRTPGIAVSVAKRVLAVSFEKEGYIPFGYNPRSGFMDGKYELINRDGRISYGDKVFRVEAESPRVFLEVDLKEIHRFEKNRRTAKGRKPE